MQTSWGSRADGDANDNLRMAPQPRPSESTITPRERSLSLPYNLERTLGITCSTLKEKHLVGDWEKLGVR